MLRWLPLPLLFLLFACLLTSKVQAQNQDGFYLDDQAAMTGGSVTSNIRGAGSLWYNPAGLGGSQRSSLDISASAFHLQHYKAKDLLHLRLGDESQSEDLDYLEFVSVPSALSGVRKINERFSMAFALYVSKMNDLDFHARIEGKGSTPDGTSVDGDFGFTVTTLGVQQHFGLGGGWDLDHLRLGCSVFISHISESSSQLQTFSLTDNSRQDALGNTVDILSFSSHQKGTTRLFGLRAIGGVQWDIAPRWTLGLTIKSPLTIVYEIFESDAEENISFEGQYIENVTGNPSSGLIDTTQENHSQSKPRWTTYEPWRLHAGANFHLPSQHYSFDVDVATPFKSNVRVPNKYKTVWNVRAGGTWSLSESFDLGVGLYTDLDPTSDPAEGTIDFYGATLGTSITRRYSVSGEDDSSSLLFRTTTAIRYAVGVGEIPGAILDPFNETGAEVIFSEAFFQQWTLHLGSAVIF